MGVEPVAVQKVETVEGLEQLLLAVIARGNPFVPTPTRQNSPPPVMERHCGLKSLSVFERMATCRSISGSGVAYRIYEWRRSGRYRGRGGTPLTVKSTFQQTRRSRMSRAAPLKWDGAVNFSPESISLRFAASYGPFCSCRVAGPTLPATFDVWVENRQRTFQAPPGFPREQRVV